MAQHQPLPRHQRRRYAVPLGSLRRWRKVVKVVAESYANDLPTSAYQTVAFRASSCAKAHSDAVRDRRGFSPTHPAGRGIHLTRTDAALQLTRKPDTSEYCGAGDFTEPVADDRIVTDASGRYVPASGNGRLHPDRSFPEGWLHRSAPAICANSRGRRRSRCPDRYQSVSLSSRRIRQPERYLAGYPSAILPSSCSP
ncbi:MAG: hypothetical protein ACLUE8_10705 [Lachnospiraceae bacterium]